MRSKINLAGFALAEGGTLFLDEIGDVSSALQVKLLRVLQEKIYEPLGGTESLRTDVRILAATNRDIKGMVDRGQFRLDLYYRLNVIELTLPALSQRREDIPLLIDHFIDKMNAERGRKIIGIKRRAMDRLIRYSYPGNIRQLQNIIERAYVLCNSDQIQEQCLPPEVLRESLPASVEPAQAIVNLRSLSPDQEKDLIAKTLDRFSWNRKLTAAKLGINPSTLWRKIKKFKIQ